MSGESRLAYHAVPKVMNSSVDGCKVPKCLSKELFQSGMPKTKDIFQMCCSLCGQNTEYLIPEDIASTKDSSFEKERQIHKRKKEDKAGKSKILAISSNAFDSNFQDENKDIEKPKAYTLKQSPFEFIVEDEMESVASNFDHSGKTVPQTKPMCSNCQWIFENWIHFETYLSFSRININVRQVGNI